MRSSSRILLPLLFSLLLHATSGELASAAPLTTDGRWIVNGSGARVKLACVNWPSHLELMLAEGLSKRPLDEISKTIRSMGFNCVRLTWPTFLVTDGALANLTVRQSFQRVGLADSVSLVGLRNPDLVDLTLVQAYKAVVSNLGDNNIMVILDNHISKPGWCCSRTDGNGFFGDPYFHPVEWMEGLTKMATMFNGSKNVIGMSLRNELRGPRENVNDWFRYMQMGAEAVHAANGDVLVILSGLNFDTDLSFLSRRRVELTFARKLVFELHWYGFTDGGAWARGNANDVCGRVAGSVMNRAGYLLDQQFPLFLSEFGLDQRGGNLNDNRYFSCILAFAADKDLDFALWTLQGSYYLREGVFDMEEVYGMLTFDWSNIRNHTLLQRIQAIQQPFQGPGVSQVSPYVIMFHPLTGLCVTMDSSASLALDLGPCNQFVQPWIYGQEGTLTSIDDSFCLDTCGAGKQVRLEKCSNSSSKWDKLSASKMHLSTQVPNDRMNLCLDVGQNGRSIVTNPCRCLGGDSSCDPEGQWFKLVTSTKAVQ